MLEVPLLVIINCMIYNIEDISKKLIHFNIIAQVFDYFRIFPGKFSVLFFASRERFLSSTPLIIPHQPWTFPCLGSILPYPSPGL